MTRNLVLIAGLAVLVAAGASFYLSRERAGPVVATSEAPASALATQTVEGEPDAPADAAEIDTSRVVEMALGNPDAPVTIVEYSSLTCPHCATFNQGVFRQIMETYVETGQVHFIKREVFFDAYGLWAALVARCGGPERYHGIVEMLYQDQRRWAGSNDGAQVAEELRRIGRRAGLENDQIDACLSDRDMATALMEVYRASAERYGVRSTPSFVINGQLHGNMSFADFSAVIAAAAAAAE